MQLGVLAGVSLPDFAPILEQEPDGRPRGVMGKPFGCLAYALHRDANKQVGKAERCIFLGLSPDNHNTYVLMSLETKEFSRFVNSRDVVCHERILPFKKAMELPAYVRENHALELEFL